MQISFEQTLSLIWGSNRNPDHRVRCANGTRENAPQKTSFRILFCFGAGGGGSQHHSRDLPENAISFWALRKWATVLTSERSSQRCPPLQKELSKQREDVPLNSLKIWLLGDRVDDLLVLPAQFSPPLNCTFHLILWKEDSVGEDQFQPLESVTHWTLVGALG